MSQDLKYRVACLLYVQQLNMVTSLKRNELKMQIRWPLGVILMRSNWFVFKNNTQFDKTRAIIYRIKENK